MIFLVILMKLMRWRERFSDSRNISTANAGSASQVPAQPNFTMNINNTGRVPESEGAVNRPANSRYDEIMNAVRRG